MANELKPIVFYDEHWMTTADAMACYMVSRRTLQRWCNKKQIMYVIMGGTKYYPKKFTEQMMFNKGSLSLDKVPTNQDDSPPPTP